MNKETTLSVLLFLLGLGFINGFTADFQQAIFAIVCFAFLAMPLCLRIAEVWLRASNKQEQKIKAA